MSNYLFLNHQSPVKKNPLVAQGVISPNSHLLIRPTSSKAQKQQVSHNNNIQMYRNMQLQPQLWIDNMGYRAKNNNSPVRSNLQEEKVIPPQYNFQYLPPQKKDPARLSHTRIERTPQQIRISRDISPLARVNMANEGVDYPVRVVRMEDRGNKEGSWNKLLNRSQEQAMSRNQKLVDWRKVLEEQVREQTMKKQQEMERVRNQELEAENRYQRQIEELSGEIEKRKRSLHKNGVLRQEPHLYPLSNASPLNQLNSNVNNITSKSHKDLRLNKEVLGQVQSMTPMPTNIRERRTKNYQREENSAYLNYSAEKSRNETLNQYIDNLKAEIFQGQEVFKSHIKDLREEAYKLGKFRNVAERNLLRAQSIDPLRSAGVSSLPSHVIYRDINELEDMANASINLVEQSHKPSKPKPVMLPPDEDKLKWDTDDFFAKLPPVKELVTGAQTMVKIEPVTEHLLAYKKPSTPIKKKIEEDMKTLEMLEDNNKRASKESIPEQSVMNKENKEVPVKPKFPSFKKIDVEMTMKENRLVTTPAKTAEQAKVIPSISSIPEARSTPKGGSKPGTQLSLGTPKNNEKPVPEDYLKIKKNFQPLTMMLNGPGHVGGTVTPSIETGSRREQILSMASRNEQTRETREIKEKLETLNLNTNEDVVEKEDQKMKKSTISEKELKKSLIREKLVKKSEGTLKVLSKFVAKDGLEAKMADNKKLQSDPLARLDFMIDYLFNYDVKGN